MCAFLALIKCLEALRTSYIRPIAIVFVCFFFICRTAVALVLDAITFHVEIWFLHDCVPFFTLWCLTKRMRIIFNILLYDFSGVEFTLTPYLVQYGVRASVDWMFLFLFTTANSHDFTSHWNQHLEITWEIEFEPFDMFEMQFAIEAKSEPIQIDDVLFRASVSLHYNQELCSTNETICVCAAVTTFLSFILSSTMTVRIVMYSCI